MIALSFSLLIVLLALLSAADMHRRQRAQGIKTNWTKTWATGLASILVSLCGIGVLVGCFEAGYPVAGVILFVVVVAAGLIAIAILVDRHWPISASRVSTTSNRD